MPHLVLVAMGPLDVDRGLWRTTDKFLSGVEALAAYFPGDVTVLGRPSQSRDESNLGARTVATDSLPITLRTGHDLAEQLTALKADVALVSLSDDHAPLISATRRVVVEAEHTGASRLAMALAWQPGSLDRVRMSIGYRLHQRRMDAMIRAAAGSHLNGEIAWQAYARLSRRPLRVYDSRMRSSWIEEAALVAPSTEQGRPLRLAFSGRLIPIKGPEYAVNVQRDLRRRGVESTLTVYGEGPMLEELRTGADPEVRFRGTIPFDPDWRQEVRRDIDVMVLPHVQGDPSGTYLESMGVGVPVLGFDTPALSSLVRDGGGGWVVPLRDANALAEEAARLSRSLEDVRLAGLAASRFMLGHSFELDFRARVDHLVHVMRGPG